MKHESKDLTEKSILERINALEPQQIAEVMDFIEFLAEKKQKENPLVRFLQENVGPPVDLKSCAHAWPRFEARCLISCANNGREIRNGNG